MKIRKEIKFNKTDWDKIESKLKNNGANFSAIARLLFKKWLNSSK